MICYVNLRTRCWVYNTYLSHQNMCFVLILKYPHTWTLKIHSIHPGPHWNMKMGDIAVSGRNILATDHMLWTVIKEKIWSPIKNILDRCPNKYNVTDRGKSWAGDRIFWGGSSSGPKPQSWSHRGYPETAPSLFWNRWTILTPGAGISMDVKLVFLSRKSLIEICHCVWMSDY